MKNKIFPITYSVVTEESASNGDFSHHGFLPRSGNVPTNRNNFPKNPSLFSLRQAVDLLQNAGSSPICCDSCPTSRPRWLDCQITEDWERPSVTLSLHLPPEVSDASARRIARLFRAYGVK